MIVITHSQEMVDEMNKRIITMERGSVISDVGGYYYVSYTHLDVYKRQYRRGL